jgi:NifU-like protein involved in Fe-S cluster formation/ADP-heptose:LPS heptosyltransferase
MPFSTITEAMERLILKSHLSPGDIVMLTAAVRDLHRAHPGRFLTDVRTTASQLWENNPHITPLEENDPDVRVIECHYPLINSSNSTPHHFIHGYVQHLEEQLRLRIPVTEFKGDIHLSDEERGWMSQVEEAGYRGRFWIVMAGGKYDFTAKWWDPAGYQQVVDHFRGRIQFVQCGEASHFHPKLDGVINLIGKTDIRQFVRLVYHADGVLCPVTFAMHLAAAVLTKPGRPRNRACVVLAGGREPAQWEAYPHHRFLSTNGALPCCEHGGCWRSRCQRVGDGDPKDRELCEHPVQVSPDLRIPKCLHMIRPADVIRAIELYYEGGALRYAGAEPMHDRGELEDVYAEHVLPRAESPRHKGRIEAPAAVGTARNSTCGDQVRLEVILEGNGRISQVKHDSRGCVISRAAAELLCEHLRGRSLAEAESLAEEETLQLLSVPLTPIRRCCALVAHEALQGLLRSLGTELI